MRFNKVGLLAVAMTLAGCGTTLESSYVGAKPKDPLEGVLYSLPMAMLNLDLDFIITGCRFAEKKVRLSHELRAANIKRTLVADPTEALVIPYARLSSAAKVTDLKIEFHPNGMISTISPNIKDSTQTILGNVASSVANIALTQISGIGNLMSDATIQTAAAGDLDKKPADPCDPIREYITRQHVLIGKLVAIKEEAEKEEKNRAAQLEKIQKSINVKEEELKKAQGAESPDPTLVQKLQGEIKSLTQEEAELKNKKSEADKLRGELASVEKILTFKVVRPGWVPRPEKPESLCEEVNEPPVAYINQLKQNAAAFIDAEVDPTPAFRAKACVEELERDGNVKLPSRPLPEDGLVYRVPAFKRVAFYQGDPPSRVSIKSNLDILPLPQLGIKASLPLRNGMFEKNNINVRFHEDGSLVKFDFYAESIAENASTALKYATSTALDFTQKRDAAKRSLDDAASSKGDNDFDSLEKQLSILTALTQLQGGASSSANQEIIQLIQEIQLERLKRDLRNLLDQ